jgi:hypothetical protein
MKYQQLQSKKPAIAKKVEAAPKMLKAGNSAPRNADMEQNKKLSQRLKQTGKVRDAALLFEKFL